MLIRILTVRNLMIELVSLLAMTAGFLLVIHFGERKTSDETSVIPVLNLKGMASKNESGNTPSQPSDTKPLGFYIGLVFILTGSVLVAVRSFVVFSSFLAKLACCVMLIFLNVVSGMMLSVLILNLINKLKK